jgi:hypothetical protein
MLSHSFKLVLLLFLLNLEELIVKFQLSCDLTLNLLRYFAVLFQHGDDLALLTIILRLFILRLIQITSSSDLFDVYPGPVLVLLLGCVVVDGGSHRS